MNTRADVRVRRAVREDLDTIIEFNVAMAQETESKALSPNLVRKGVAAVFDSHGKGVYYVAESGGQVVGQLLITTEWSDWRNGIFWWIQSVYVHEDFRRKGVYRRPAESHPGCSQPA